MNLKENYERFFGKLVPETKPVENNGKLTKDNVKRWNHVQKLFNNQYPGSTVSVLGEHVYLNGRKVEPSKVFFQRSNAGMIQKLKSKIQGFN